MEQADKYITESRPHVGSAEDVARIMRPITQDMTQEVMFVLCLDTKGCVSHIHEATKGLLDRSQIHEREVFHAAILHASSSIILVHNHPSGNPDPSSADIRCTKKLVEAGKILEIKVMDHIILGRKTEDRKKDYVSLQELGQCN